MIRNLVCLLVSITIATPSEIAAAEHYVSIHFAANVGAGGGASRQLTAMPDVERKAEFDIDEARETAFDIADQYGTSNYYVNDLVDKLDFEPANAFEFVRDSLAIDPYAGSLRGEMSVLSAGAGNPLDRAVLLQRLVRDMGYDARLAFGELSGDPLDRIAKRSIERASTWDIGPLAAMGGFVPQMMQRFVDRARRDYHWLKTAVPPGSLTQASAPDIRGRLKNHVWVQANLDDGWTDLDPSFADSAIGDRYAEVDQYRDEIPAELRQKVRIKIVAEYLTEDGVAEDISLEHEIDADAAAASQVYLTFRPTSIGMGSTLAEKLGAKPSFQPMLIVNDEKHTGSALPLISQAQNDAERFLFGTGAARELTALYLDVETVIPGGTGTARRRPLLDRLPASVRADDTIVADALLPVEHSGNVPTPFRDIHQVVTSHGGSNPFQVANDVGLAVYFVGEYFGDEDIMKRMGVDELMWPTAMLRRIPVAVSEQVSVSALNDRDDLRFFIGEPRVFVFSLSGSVETEDDPFSVTVDLLVDRVDVAALGNVRAADIAARQMRYGVIQGAFETTYLETMTAASGVPGNLNSASRLSTQQAVVYRAPGDISSLDSVPNAMREDLLSGKRVVVGSQQVGAATDVWWSVDDNGETRAMLAPGLGGSGWWTTWGQWTNINPFARSRVTHTNYVPENMTQAEIRREQDRAIRDWLKQEAEKKANKSNKKGANRAARTSRAGRTPKVSRRSGGGNEYATVQEVALAVLETGVGFFALILTATLIAAFIVIFAFIAIYNTSRGRDWDYHTPFNPESMGQSSP